MYPCDGCHTDPTKRFQARDSRPATEPRCRPTWLAGGFRSPTNTVSGVAETPEQPTPDAAVWLADLLYTGVGLGILAMNKAQVARRDLQTALADGDKEVPDLTELQAFITDPERTARVLDRLRSELQELDSVVGGIEQRVGSLFDALEPDLPPAAREMVEALRGLAGEHADQIRTLLGIERH
jgi:hypothetical protein